MEKDKNNTVTYILRICFNPDTEVIEYISEGMDEDFNFTPINPFDLKSDSTAILTCEDMESMKELYNIEEN